MEYLLSPEKKWSHTLTVPFIYAVFLVAILLDIIVELYHRVCFPVYGIPLVPREAYIKIDRHKLEYLTLIQKLHCMYCGYVNGLFRYVTAIGAKTEKYWCAIQHKQNPHEIFAAPDYQDAFLPYNDKEAFEQFRQTEKRSQKQYE
ncbi:MAG: hypothetical protein COU68_04010 [Candidatus Pacebacteria bacterium CG10_big_fil_rev_8_21_14_0_10_45_6]|nr:MAG: hypothetical protein COU68_04010 [Candidatus Pacebacteria bacterium CG10_big_fil_rev_8_21_14_0_10_45_6]